MLLTLLFLYPPSALADAPPYVNYGPRAPAGEGDPDHRQFFYIAVPLGHGGPVHIRILDGDTGGDWDTPFGRLDTTTRFAVYGGVDAYAGAPRGENPGDGEAAVAGLGFQLADWTVAEDATVDGDWHTLASLEPASGARVQDEWIFRLEVHTLAGNDGNVFDVAVSSRADANRAVPGARLFSHELSLRLPPPDRELLLPFSVPERLTVANFDLSGGAIRYVGPFRAVRLEPSAQARWRVQTLTPPAEAVGGAGALALSGGREQPNDLSLLAIDGVGRQLAFALPPHQRVPNARPRAVFSATALDCQRLALDAGDSRDPEGEPLRYRWLFADGSQQTGPRVEYRPADRAGELIRLEVRDPVGLPGAGAALERTIGIRPPPDAAIQAPVRAAPGDRVEFRAVADTVAGARIVDHRWDLGDGNQATGPTPDHAYAEPGRYRVRLRVRDDSGHACDHASAAASIVVNAPPLAVAGPDRQLTTGEVLSLDAGESRDPDGWLVHYHWDLGDGREAEGPTVPVAYEQPGRYTLTLTVRDDSGLANDSATDKLVLSVVDPPNAPPLADAGPDRTVTAGEIVRLNGTGSRDPDGNLLAYHWRFGDGSTGAGPTPVHRFRAPGTYRVVLAVTDDAGLPGNRHEDLAMFTVVPPPNRAPEAVAGEDRTVTVGEILTLDASASRDPDGRILDYHWDLGDGRELSGIRREVVYHRPGVYAVRLELRDDSRAANDTASASFQLTVVAPENLPPLALAGADRQAVPGEVLVFDGRDSQDPDGELLAYHWDPGDASGGLQGPLVQHAYAAPGEYPVTLTVVDDHPHGAARGEARFTVRVNAPPVAVAGDYLQVAVGQPLQLDGSASHDPDGTLIRFHWDLGDGSSARGETVTHAYAAPGDYPVTLTVSDDSGLANQEARDRTVIAVNAPPVAEAGADLTAVVGELLRFDAGESYDPDGDPLGYRWAFGDGDTSTRRQPTHAYREPGEYRVWLTVDDNTGLANARAVDARRVLVQPRPNQVPLAEAGPERRVRLGEPVLFDGTAASDPDGNLIAFRWSFGDGGSVSARSPRHVYWQRGRYMPWLTVTDDDAPAGASHQDFTALTVIDPANRAPLARAGADISALVGEVLHFDGSASLDHDGTIVAYRWDFGDGSTGDGPTLRHAYARPGRYRVRLTVTDNSGLPAGTVSDELMVRVFPRPNAPPVAVAGADLAVAMDETIQFDPGDSHDPDGNLVGYFWDFGDGNSSARKAPVHRYPEPGTYTVTLTVWDEVSLAAWDDPDRLAHQQSDTLTVVVNDPPIAEAGADQWLSVSEVALDASASLDRDGALIDYHWDFGDGSEGSGVATRHVYAEPGSYEVTLTVTDDSGTRTASTSDTLTVVINDLPVARFEGPTRAVPGEVLVFDAGASADSDGRLSDYHWSFGDGDSTRGPRVEKRFEAPGIYQVRLRVADNSGHEQAVAFAEQTVRVNAPPVAVAGRDRVIATGESVRLDGRESHDPDGEVTAHFWRVEALDVDFRGPVFEQRFDDPGRYVVILTVRDDVELANSRVSDELLVVVNRQPIAEAGADVFTDRRWVSFDARGSRDHDGDALTYHWDFGDGASASGAVAAHRYAAGGEYQAILTVDDGSGASNASAEDTRTVRINRRPTAVAGENRNICLGDVLNFDASASSDPDLQPLAFHWDFGDGSSAEAAQVRKTFDTPGLFPVTLTVDDGSALANAQHQDRLHISVSDRPQAEAGPDMRVCVNASVVFDGRGSTDLDGVVNRYQWDFGDGNSGGGDTPSHAYTRPGVYVANLTIEGDPLPRCDNVATDFVRVAVVAAPEAVIDAPAVAPLGVPVDFDASATALVGEGEIERFIWDFGDGATAEGKTVRHVFREPGDYRVSLAARVEGDGSGCDTGTASHGITINAPPEAVAGADQQAATGQPLRFSAADSHDPDGALTAYRWDFGDGNTAGGLDTVHSYTEAGVYTVTLTVQDDSGVANNTARDALTVTVLGPRAPEILGPRVSCVGETARWRVTDEVAASLEPGRLTWLFGDGETGQGHAVSHAYDQTGAHDLSLLLAPGSEAEPAIQSHLQVMVNTPPVADAGRDLATCPGDTLRFDGGDSFDLDGDGLSAVWDFGDGNRAETLVASHTYDKPGRYRASLTITDDSGSSCAVVGDSIWVQVNAPPVAEAGPDLQGFAGGANDVLVLDGSASSDPDGDDLAYHWQIDDHTEARGQQVRHRFERGGEYRILLTVSDKTGLACGTASDDLSVTIRER